MYTDDIIEKAQKYTEDILSFFGSNISVEVTEEDGVINIAVPSTENNSLLIGRNAETLRSLQHIILSALRNESDEQIRINLDIADYKKQRADKLAKQAAEWIEEVRSTGDSKVLRLNPADRRIVHRVASEYSDIATFSSGEGRDRKITIAQASS